MSRITGNALVAAIPSSTGSASPLMSGASSAIGIQPPMAPEEYAQLKSAYVTLGGDTGKFVVKVTNAGPSAANGATVRDGIIANNMLAFGTQVRIPQLYGNKVFTVEDRMHWRKSNYQIDIWFPSLDQAVNFGVKTAYIEVLN